MLPTFLGSLILISSLLFLKAIPFTVSRDFFNHRRKMLKKPFNQLFNGDIKILDKLKIDLNLRPHNLDLETYYKLVIEYENLRG